MIASEQATHVDRQTDDRREKTRFIMISAANAVAVAKAVTLGSHFGIVFFYMQLSVQVRAPHIFYSSLSTSSGTILEIGNLSVGHPFVALHSIGVHMLHTSQELDFLRSCPSRFFEAFPIWFLT